MNVKNLVSIENLHYARQGRRIIQNLNFSAKLGDCVVLTGANGSGKSTTLNIVAGLLKPQSGKVFIQGTDIHQSLLQTKKSIGYLPDRPPLYHDLTVKEYLKLVQTLRLMPRSFLNQSLHETLKRLSLVSLQNRVIATLSRGQQQRVGIAQAIIHNPKILILDEPTQGLDPDQIDSFIDFLNAYKKEACIIFSSHHFAEFGTLCNKRLQFSRLGIEIYDLDACTT